MGSARNAFGLFQPPLPLIMKNYKDNLRSKGTTSLESSKEYCRAMCNLCRATEPVRDVGQSRVKVFGVLRVPRVYGV